MVRAPHPEFFRRFRFAVFVNGVERPVALSFARETVHGLELGRPHGVERPTLYNEVVDLPAHATVVVELHGRETGPSGAPLTRRIFRYVIGERRRRLSVDLDTCVDAVAIDRVLFPDAELISTEDETAIPDAPVFTNKP